LSPAERKGEKGKISSLCAPMVKGGKGEKRKGKLLSAQAPSWKEGEDVGVGGGKGGGGGGGAEIQEKKRERRKSLLP